MIVETLVLGDLENNCYFLIKNNDLIIIDPAAEINKIIDKIDKYNLIGIIITHHHFDHVGALKDLVDKYNVPVYDYSNLAQGTNTIGNFMFKCLLTKGHTSDSISIYFEEEKIMFVGDFIFKDSIGRTDIGGNMNDMIESINMMKKYNGITLYPGHGPKTTIDYEKENNYYFNI